MSALVLDGKALAAQCEQQLTERVAALKAQSGGKTPILATILVGADPALNVGPVSDVPVQLEATLVGATEDIGVVGLDEAKAIPEHSELD